MWDGTQFLPFGEYLDGSLAVSEKLADIFT